MRRLNGWQTAKNLIRLYRAKPLKNRTLKLLFESQPSITIHTDERGFFHINTTQLMVPLQTLRYPVRKWNSC